LYCLSDIIAAKVMKINPRRTLTLSALQPAYS